MLFGKLKNPEAWNIIEKCKYFGSVFSFLNQVNSQ